MTETRRHVDLFDPETLKRTDLTPRERNLAELWSGASKQQIKETRMTCLPRDVRSLKGLDAMRDSLSRRPIRGLDGVILGADEERRFLVETRWQRFWRWVYEQPVAADKGSRHEIIENALMILFFALVIVLMQGARFGLR